MSIPSRWTRARLSLPSANRFEFGPITQSPFFRLVLLVTLICALGAGTNELWTRVVSRLHFHRDLSWYGLGFQGLAPSVQYDSFEGLAPLFEFPQWDSRCSQDLVFLGWRGHNVKEPGATILDPQGNLVWRQTGYSIDQNDFKPQVYRGERFLTFQMDGEDGDESQGYWYMLDESYQIRYRLRPHQFPHADMHEFHITKDDTALIITTIPMPYDLRSIGGPERGWIINDYFQEIDIETGELLFEWASADHFSPDTTMEAQDNCLIDPSARFAGCGNDKESPFDYYHLNSAEKDSNGNYLISARNVWGISYVDGQTGDVLWTVGAGKVNDFEDISGGNATAFAWQHHARWVEEGKSFSYFDNHYHRLGDPYGPSGGRVVEIDQDSKTVQLRQAYNHPYHIKPESQGSMQHLENNNYMVGWGSSGAFTEFAADGEVLCDARFGAEAFFEFSPVSSYRVFRGSWTGRPTYPPSFSLDGSRLYVSWNGATDVRRWQVEMIKDPGAKAGAKADAEAGEDVGEVAIEDAVQVIAQQFKDGFETAIDLPREAAGALIRVVALDEDGEQLGVTDFLEAPPWGSLGSSPFYVLVTTVVSVFLVSVCGVVVLWACLWRRRRSLMGSGGYERLDVELDEQPPTPAWKQSHEQHVEEMGRRGSAATLTIPPGRA